jgi:hypothetical protein
MHDTVLGGSTSVDIRSTTFKGNVDSTFLQGVETEAVATALKGGAGLSIQSTQRIMLVDLHFDGNKAWQGGALLLDSCFATVIWASTFTNNSATPVGSETSATSSVSAVSVPQTPASKKARRSFKTPRAPQTLPAVRSVTGTGRSLRIKLGKTVTCIFMYHHYTAK